MTEPLTSFSDTQDIDPNQRVASDEELEAAQKQKRSFFELPKKRVAKRMRQRWDRLEKVVKKKQTDLKVNYLRYLGNTQAQVNPRDPDRIIVPDQARGRTPPVLNKLRRSVHRYVAQVTSDEPIMEAMPAAHQDKDLDAAEAATHALRGEWHRLSLNRELERVTHIASIFRSGFWFFEWDDSAGGKRPAQKFFRDKETGEKHLEFVKREDGEDKIVDSAEDASNIWQGNIRVEVMTPFNVRWSGGRYAHDANELMVAKLVRLRDLYESFPDTRDMKLDKLLGGVPKKAEKWLQNIRGEEFSASMSDEFDGDLDKISGHELEDDSGMLDEQVFVMHYFLRESRRYPKGFHGILAGSQVVHRGGLRYGTFPIAHFKLMDEVSEPLGVSLLDMLRDPQELLDFVRGQILKHLQMLKRRWFLPQQANVSARDLNNPTKSVIEYNARVDPPKAETQPELNKSYFEFLKEAKGDFDDLLGLHPTSKGEHVPGVSSGRHAEALRSGDETLLGMTRTQIKEALEQAALIILKVMKKEWTTERRVRYMGEARQYIDKAFRRVDFRDTADVRLRESTLLMLTPAQKLETIFAFAEMGALTPDMVRRLAPLRDTAGLSLSEDQHVISARRENERFLQGPDDEAEDAYETFKKEMKSLQEQVEKLRDKPPEQAQAMMQGLEQRQAEIEGKFDTVIGKKMPRRTGALMLPQVATLHVEEHAEALAKLKTERLPEWWVEWFEEKHLAKDLEVLRQGKNQGEENIPGNGLGSSEREQAANPGGVAPPGLGA